MKRYWHLINILLQYPSIDINKKKSYEIPNEIEKKTNVLEV